MEKIRNLADNFIADYGTTINGESMGSAEARLLAYINGMGLDPVRHNGLMEAIGNYRKAAEHAVVMTCVEKLTRMLLP